MSTNPLDNNNYCPPVQIFDPSKRSIESSSTLSLEEVIAPPMILHTDSEITAIVQNKLSKRHSDNTEAADPLTKIVVKEASDEDLEFKELRELLYETNLFKSEDEIKEPTNNTNPSSAYSRLTRAQSSRRLPSSGVKFFDETTTKLFNMFPIASEVAPPSRRVASTPNMKDTKVHKKIHISRNKQATFNEGRVVANEVLREELSYLIQMPTALYFKESKAAEALSRCLQMHSNQSYEICKILEEISGKLTSKQHHIRLRNTLTLFSLDSDRADFLRSYFITKYNEINPFAKHLIEKLFKEQNHCEIHLLLSAFTEVDFAKETPDTFSRETSLSSSLYKEYGSHLWKSELKTLCDEIHQLLKINELSKLCLKRELMVETLNRESPDFTKMQIGDKDTLIEQRLKLQIPHFIRFARQALTLFYAIKIHPDFSDLLQTRRSHIYQFLIKQPTQKYIEGSDAHLEYIDTLSRTYIAELLFLRILNPQLLTIESSAEAKSVLVSLTKVFQCLAKQAPFGDEKSDPLYEMLNPLYDEFYDPHCAFMDLHTRPRNLST